jgi:hypothetical protein
LYERARTLARKRGTSINQLAASGLQELARKDREEELRQAYERLAADAAGTDVEPFLAAQSDVLEDDEQQRHP